MITLYLSGIFVSKSVKIIPSAEFFPEGTGYFEIFFNLRRGSFTEHKFHLQ